MNLADLKKEKDAVNNEIADFRERSRTGKVPADIKAWIAEEKRLLAKRDAINKRIYDYCCKKN
jgi:hypothetical protein